MGRVTFDNVTKVYDGSNMIVAVEELDFEIENGEFLVLVGPSGCGKSTTLRMVAGLESITDGEVSIGDQVVNNVAPKNRGIAMVFQDYALYPHKTVRQNMSYGLQLSSNLSDEEIERRVVEAAEMMGIDDLLDKRPGSLSGGQQQRVATGRAIVREPEVFLFDEPLSNLDAKLRTHMRTELSRIHSELGITSIYVTHDQEEAMTMADRIAVMNDGTLQQVGTPLEVYYEPTNLFVANFIGSPSINLFDVKYENSQLIHNGFEYRVSDEEKAVIESTGEDELVLGIRPENIALEGSEALSDTQTINATIDVTETVGSENFVYSIVGGEECRVRTMGRTSPREGEEVKLIFDESEIHLFDASSGEAIHNGSEQHGTAEDDGSPQARTN